jgi:hypothetical protein
MDCPVCGKKGLSRIGQHWSMSCSHPRINSVERSIFTGLLMGDGHIPPANKNTHLRVRMVNKEFLNWLDNEVSLPSKVKFIKSAEESAKQNRDRDFRPEASAENYSDVYELRTAFHPYFTALRKIFYTPNKEFTSENILLNSESVRMWYVCDGTLRRANAENRRPAVEFRLDSQSDLSQELADKVSEKFDITARASSSGNVIRVSTEDTDRMFEWLGKPPTGFKHKWI